MKKIPLTQNKFALVDDCDYDFLNQFKWRFSAAGYAVRHNKMVNGVRSGIILMHRIILKASAGLFVDHRDGNGLNNQRSNLRESTNSQNQANVGIRSNSTCGKKGVCFVKDKGMWKSRIMVGGRRILIGYFKNIEDASNAYDEAALKYFGEFARVGV